MLCSYVVTHAARRKPGTLIQHGTLLHVAAGGKNVQTIDILIDRGLDVNATVERNEVYVEMTPLYIAIIEDRVLIVEKLMVRFSIALISSEQEKCLQLNWAIELESYWIEENEKYRFIFRGPFALRNVIIRILYLYYFIYLQRQN